MDHYSKNSAAQPVLITSFADAVVVFKNLGVAQFGSPKEVRGDLAFYFDIFKSLLAQYNIAFASLPPRRHYKNLIETKHGIIRAKYLRLLNATPDCEPKLHAVSAVRISNEMYGSDKLSAY